jgi:hypothetical protein
MEKATSVWLYFKILASSSPPIQGSIIIVPNIDQYNNFGKYNRKYAYVIRSKKYKRPLNNLRISILNRFLGFEWVCRNTNFPTFRHTLRPRGEGICGPRPITRPPPTPQRLLGCGAVSTGKVTDVFKDNSAFIFMLRHSLEPDDTPKHLRRLNLYS